MFSKRPDEEKTAPETAVNVAATPKQAESPKIDFRYVDRPECLETYADTLTSLLFDGQVLRLEFGKCCRHILHSDRPSPLSRGDRHRSWRGCRGRAPS